MSDPYVLDFNLDNINQSAVLLFSCLGAGVTGPYVPGPGATYPYNVNSNGYYCCPLCYGYSTDQYEGATATFVSNILNVQPNIDALINAPNDANPVNQITVENNSYTWTEFDSAYITNEIYTLWCHMYNLIKQQTGPSGSSQLSLYQNYSDTLTILMTNYLDSSQYNNITSTTAMMISHSRMFNMMSVSSNMKCNSSLTNKMVQSNTRILMDDVYDYTLVPYDMNPSIQSDNSVQFVLTKTLHRFLELLNMSLINPNYNLNWIDTNEGNDNKVEEVVQSKIDINVSISAYNSINGSVVPSSTKTYYMNTKSARCLINFFTSFGSFN